MQSDPLLGILSNIDTICQSAISDFSNDNNESFMIVNDKIQSIRNCQQHKICNRVADLCSNIITCISPGNTEFKSQVFSLITSVTNVIKVYESLMVPSVEHHINNTVDNVALEQCEIECQELKNKVSQLEKQSKTGSFTLCELRTKLFEFDSIVQDNENLKFEITRFQDKLDKIEERSVQDLSSIKKAVALSGQKIEELEEELSLAHKARHQSSVSAQNAIADFRVARQNQESADIKAKELEGRLKEAQSTISGLEFKVAQVTDQLSSACLTHSDMDAKVARLESQLRGLDKAEAAMISAQQAKTFADNRILKLEADVLGMTRSRDALQDALGARETDCRRLTLSREMATREMMVLRAEVATLVHMAEERESRLKETTMTMHAQHNQIVMCALQQMESTTREQAAQAETVKAHVEIAAMNEALLRAQAEHERVMDLLLTAQEKLVAVTNEHDTFNSGGDSPPPTPIVSALFSRVNSIHTNSSLNISSSVSQGGINSGGSRSSTPPRSSLFAMPKRAISILEDRVASAVGGGTNRDYDSTSLMPTDFNVTKGSMVDLQQAALVEELRRDLHEATMARHHSDMTVMTLKTELSSTRELLDEYQSRAESKRDYQELMRLRLQFRSLEAQLLDVTTRCDQLVRERDSLLLQMSSDSVENIKIESVITNSSVVKDDMETVEAEQLAVPIITDLAATTNILEAEPVLVDQPDLENVADASLVTEQNVVQLDLSAEQPSESCLVDSSNVVIEDPAVDQQCSAETVTIETEHHISPALEHTDPVSELPVLLTRRFVASSEHPIVYLEINASDIQLGLWIEKTGTLQPVFSCPAYVAHVRPEVDREQVLSILQQRCVEDEEHAALDPSICEFFRETGVMVGHEAQLCLAPSTQGTADGDDPSSPALASLFEKELLLTSEGRLGSPLALCYVILHCVLKGLGLEELGELQLLCRHPDTFSVDDKATLVHVLFDDLGVGKASLVSDAQLIADCCVCRSSAQLNSTDSLLVIHIDELSTVLVPVSAGRALEGAVVRCAIGELHVAELLSALLEPQLSELSSNPDVQEWLVKNSSSVARDALAGLRSSHSRSCTHTFTALFGERNVEMSLSIDSSKLDCSALFLTPSLVASCASESSLLTLIARSMGLVADSALRADIFSRVSVTGCTTLLADLATRIQTRLQSSSHLSGGGDSSSQSYHVTVANSWSDDVSVSTFWRGAERRLGKSVASGTDAPSGVVVLATDFEVEA